MESLCDDGRKRTMHLLWVYEMITGHYDYLYPSDDRVDIGLDAWNHECYGTLRDLLQTRMERRGSKVGMGCQVGGKMALVFRLEDYLIFRLTSIIRIW